MRKLLSALAATLLAAAASYAQTTTITASHIAQDLSGSLLPSGQLCLTPVGVSGAPSGFQASGVQYVAQQTCVTVTNGAIDGFTVPDVLDINPPGIGYKVMVADVAGNVLRNYEQPIFPTGSTWSLDAWSPTATVTVPHPPTVSRSVNPPQGRCGLDPAIDYTSTTVYTCINQIWVAVVSSSGGVLSGATIAAALTYTPVSPSSLSSAIGAIPPIDNAHVLAAIGFTPTSLADVNAAINAAVGAYVPVAGGVTLTGAVKQTVAPVDPADLVNKAYVDGLITSGAPAIPTFSPAGGTYTSVQTVTLADVTGGATISYCINPTGNCAPNTSYAVALTVSSSETICTNAQVGSSGTVSATSCNVYIINTGSGPTNTGIGTVLFQSYLTDGSLAYKTCYVGGSVCSGGVGSIAPSSVPTHTFSLNTPSASTGLSNKVGNFHLELGTTSGFGEALWTTTGGGVGANATPTNYYVGGWMKAVFAAGPWRLEFDPYAFDSGWDWMWGTQCNGDNNLIQTANQSSSWTSTPVNCAKLHDGNYHHVEMTFHRTVGTDTSCSGAPCEVWDTIAIDGVSSALNVTMPATTSSWAGSGWQFQIDGKPTTASGGTPAVYNLWVDSAQFIAGTAATGSSPGGGGTSVAGTGDLDSFNFDSGTTIPAGLTAVGSPVISASQEHTTPNSAHFPSGLNYFTDSISPTKTFYTRQYVYLNTVNSSLPDSFLRFYHGGAELFVYFFDSPTQHITYFDQATGSSITAYSTTFPTAGWHRIETYTKIDPTVGHVTVKVDGTQVYDSGSFNTGTSTIDTVWFGNIGATAPTGWDVYQDNVDFDDTAFIGPI